MIAMIARAHAAAGTQTGDHVDHRQEDEELAYEIAMTDLSEKDHAGAAASAAAARLKAAAGELLRATLALICALVAKLLLASAAEAVAGQSNKITVGAERSVLAVDRLLQSFFWRRVAGRRRLLALFGARSAARSVTDERTSKSRRLKLATRNYRSGQKSSGLGYAVAADAPTVHVMLGVSVEGTDEPIYRIRRFVESEQGGFTEVKGFHSTDTAEALVEFLASPDLARLTAEDDSHHRSTTGDTLADNKPADDQSTDPQTAA